MSVKTEDGDTCSGCRLAVPGAAAGCQRLFDALIARDFSDVLFFRVHRLAVDTYSLQHPERYCASAKSLAAHLVGMCWILEMQGNAAVGGEPIRRWLDGPKRLPKPELPTFRGSLTIADVLAADTPSQYAAAVRRWAESTWSAYAALQGLARGWAHDALALQTPR